MRDRVAVRSTGGRLSLRVAPRAVVALLALGCVAVAGMVANVAYGEYPVAPLDVVRTVLGMETGDGRYSFIVNTLRLPRALVALLVGAALAISGAILQVFATISREQLGLVDADVLVWIVNSSAEREALTSDPLYARLDAVKERRDLFLEVNEPLAGAPSFGTVLSLPFLLDGLTPRLEAALDGDPGTTTPS